MASVFTAVSIDQLGFVGILYLVCMHTISNKDKQKVVGMPTTLNKNFWGRLLQRTPLFNEMAKTDALTPEEKQHLKELEQREEAQKIDRELDKINGEEKQEEEATRIQ